MSNELRVNERIRISPVRVVRESDNLGIMTTSQAMSLARAAGLDLVEVAPNGKPPVCRIMDFGKFKYEQSVKERKNKSNQKAKETKQIRLRPVTDVHDLEIKTKAIIEFLKAGHAVQLNMKFQSRENAHKDLGFQIINDIMSNVADYGETKSKPNFMGKFLTCMIGPKKS